MDVLAIITARGGSKRLPGKNIRMLHGKPLIAWTIEAARNCSRVVVTTDSEEIGDISLKLGAEVVWRPDRLATDDSKSMDVVLHAIDVIEWEGRTMLLQPTSPLRTSEDIENAMLMMDRAYEDNLVSVNEALETNGAIYLSRNFYWQKHQSFIGPNTLRYIMPNERSVDIDTLEDFELAEKIMATM